MTFDIIETDDAPTPAGHYSQAIRANGFVFVAGILPIIPGAKREIPDAIDAQTDQVLLNLNAILEAAQSDRAKVVNVQIFTSDVGLWSAINERYRLFFGDHKPARTIIPCGPLKNNVLIEMNAVALVS